ncbi:Structural maintenance of chromosomes protein [Fasciola gigantica]|uniref:Structural maintenance of chromosomes protein n=1 Tax=Fasciola gigantica TaxID=46835 RepID=A0A504Z0I9_FASGI|nr:Structural maintenance of chromosomes protein [Fasciola gigantica]
MTVYFFHILPKHFVLGCQLSFQVVPNSAFVISRRAYRDNSSNYWINDSRAVYRDVSNLLRLHGVDLDHNRFLILQGEVEQIALMKPKAPTEHEDGFLEYLEDIIGSSRFKQPLTIYADRIEKLNDLRLEKLTRVKAVEKEKDELEDVRNEAMDYLRLVNQVTRTKNIMFQKNLAAERAAEASAKERLSVAQEECKNLAAEIKEKSSELTKTEAERDEVIERHAKLQTRHRETKAKFSEFEAEDSRLRDEHAHIKATGRRLTKALQTERTKVEELERLPGEADARRQAIQRQLSEIEEAKKKHEAAYQETVDSLAVETAPLRLKVEAAEAALAPLQSEADDLSSRLTLERQQFDLVMAGQRREQERADNARKGVQEAQKKLAEREAELTEAKQCLSSAPINNTARHRSSQSSGVANLQIALNSASRDLGEVKTQEATLTKEVNELRAKLAESKSSFQADNSRGRVLAALLEAKRSGQLPGILGRLGDLAAVPQKYDVAISTACAALDNIVTDTMDTAQKAVIFLKKNNLGLATFIGLDKMQKWADKARATFTVPQGTFHAERLFDLIEIDDESIRPAFYFALRDTLVTDNMDAAVKIAFQQRQRHRVVTLQGHLIETSGAMSGGGGRPSSGRMLTTLAQVRDRRKAMERGNPSGRDSLGKNASEGTNLAQLEQKLTRGDAELSRLREARGRLEEVVTRLTRQREEAERTVKRCETECARLRDQVAMLSTEVNKAEERARSIGPSAAEQQQLRANLTKLEKQTKQKVDQAQKKRAEVEKLKAELLDVGSVRLTAVRSRLDAFEEKAKETQDQLTKLEVSVKTAARNHEKALTKVTNIEAELEAVKNRLTEVDRKLKELEEEARTCMTEFQQIQADVEELQKTKDAAQQKLTVIEAALTDVRKAEAAAQRNMAQFVAELSQATSKARCWQRELRGLRLHRIDEDEMDEEDSEAADQTHAVDADQPALSQATENLTQCTTNQPMTDGTTVSPSAPKKRRRQSTDLPTYTVDQLQALSVDEQELKHLEERIASMAPNMAAIEEFRRKAETYLIRVSELNHITAVLSEQRKLMEDAKSKRLSEFLDGFHSITAKLKEMYQMITQGGDAELELIDSLDPFSEGIVFSVRPPKKSWKNIANLSGGEKTLSSLALVFALHHYKPTPLYVMDEIDAALDFKNVSIVGNYLKERTKNAQFIVISLRNNMFELSDRLVGIYKTYNITKTITLDPGPLMDRLSKLVMRVATAHGREKDLQEYQQQQLLIQQQQQQQQQQSTQVPPITRQTAYLIESQPTQSAERGTCLSAHFFDGQTAEQPIKISEDSPRKLEIFEQEQS